MNITPLKYIIYIQNVTCVFRNFWSYGKCSRGLIIIWIVMDVAAIVSNVVYTVLFPTLITSNAEIIYLFLATGFSGAIIILAVRHSYNFQLLAKNFDTYHKLNNDKVYSLNLLKAQKSVTTIASLYIGAKMAIFIYVYMFYSDYVVNFSPLRKALYIYNTTLCDFRFVFEYLFLHGVLYIISEQLNAITRSIDQELSTRNCNEGYDEENRINVTTAEDLLKKFDLWMTSYKNTSCSSKLCNEVFSAQLTMMLFILTIYFIMLLYSFVTPVVGLDSKPVVCINIYTTMIFLFAMYLMSRTGQRVQDSSITLRRKLCELYVISLENEKYCKLTKELLRCCYTHPVHIHVMGSVDVNMSMLPSCVAFVSTNTVIALQFNNVL